MGDVPGATTFRSQPARGLRPPRRPLQPRARARADRRGRRRGRVHVPWTSAAGPGALTHASSRRCSGAGSVTAVEPSQTFAAACRERVPGARVETRPGRGAAVRRRHAPRPCPPESVVNFMGDPRAGVGEMRRVTRPGGTVAAAVWDYAGEMTLVRTFWDAARALDPAAERARRRHMAYCTPEGLGGLWVDRRRWPSVAVAARRRERRLRRTSRTSGPRWSWASRPRAPTWPRWRPSAAAALKEEFRRRLGVGDTPFRLDRARVARDRPGPLTTASAAVPGAAEEGGAPPPSSIARRSARPPSATPAAGCSG